ENSTTSHWASGRAKSERLTSSGMVHDEPRSGAGAVRRWRYQATAAAAAPTSTTMASCVMAPVWLADGWERHHGLWEREGTLHRDARSFGDRQRRRHHDRLRAVDQDGGRRARTRDVDRPPVTGADLLTSGLEHVAIAVRQRDHRDGGRGV